MQARWRNLLALEGGNRCDDARGGCSAEQKEQIDSLVTLRTGGGARSLVVVDADTREKIELSAETGRLKPI